MREKERKILVELSKNSRIAKSSLAKKVGVSQESINYTLKELYKKYDLTYHTIINYQALGFERYGVFLQLKNIKPKEEKEFFKIIENHKLTSYIGPLIGKWNVVFDIFVKDKNQLHQVVEEILKPTQDKVEQIIINTPYIPEEFYQTKLFGEYYVHKKPEESIKTSIDEKDKKILTILSENARITYAELSKKINLTANGIKKRIKLLEKNKIILGYGLGINLFKLGYEWYVVQIKIQNNIRTKLQEFLREHKRVLFIYQYMGLGDWDADIGIFVKQTSEVREAIIKLKEEFGEYIQIINMFIIESIRKENITPKGVFE